MMIKTKSSACTSVLCDRASLDLLFSLNTTLSAFSQWFWHLLIVSPGNCHLFSFFSKWQANNFLLWEQKKNQIKNVYDNFITFYDVYRDKNTPTHVNEINVDNFLSIASANIYDEKWTSVAYDSVTRIGCFWHKKKKENFSVEYYILLERIPK